MMLLQALQQRSKVTRERVQSILSCLEEMDLKRMQCLRDALTRAGVFVAANLRHMQYDLERSIQVGYQCYAAATVPDALQSVALCTFAVLS